MVMSPKVDQTQKDTKPSLIIQIVDKSPSIKLEEGVNGKTINYPLSFSSKFYIVLVPLFFFCNKDNWQH